MTPKEKAEELYCKYDSLFKAPYKNHQQIKNCCLIAVDKILYFMDIFNLDLNMPVQFEWWKKVRSEIENF
jgi:hypothetical protein